MKVLAWAAAFALLAAAPEPQAAVQQLSAGSLVRSHFATPRGATVSVESAVFPRDRVRIGVLDYPFGGPPGAMVERSIQENVLAAISGGYFGPGRRPEGLLVIDGAVHAPPVAGRSGLVGTTNDGRPVVAWIDGFDLRTVRDGIQAGPFVVDPGGTPGIRRDDGGRARRSLVILSNDAIAVAVTSECTLFELQDALLRSPRLFGVDRVERALNLSGDASSGFAVRLPDGKVETVPERIRVRTVLTILRRTPDPPASPQPKAPEDQGS